MLWYDMSPAGQEPRRDEIGAGRVFVGESFVILVGHLRQCNPAKSNISCSTRSMRFRTKSPRNGARPPSCITSSEPLEMPVPGYKFKPAGFSRMHGYRSVRIGAIRIHRGLEAPSLLHLCSPLLLLQFRNPHPPSDDENRRYRNATSNPEGQLLGLRYPQ